ncbi:MAG TPA: PQQ-binding-like beta-propeller repeat protein [Polyangia bacterium]|nr:PQQ-binding-like beta-propeller repeat protein [Polyangia bacterium]
MGLVLATLLGAAPTAFANDWPSLGLADGRGRASDEKSGAPFSVAWNASPSAGPFVSSPAVVDGSIVVAGAQGDLSAINALDGSAGWSVKAAGNLGASPAIDHGRIYVPTLTGQLQAFHLGTGVSVWTRDFGGHNYASPAVISDTMGTSLVLGAGFPQQKIVRLSASTGATQWETAPAAVADLVSSSAALGAGAVMFGMNGGRYQTVDALTGVTGWQSDVKGAVGMSAPLLVGPTAYFLPGGSTMALFAADATTGTQLPGWPVQIADASAPAADTVATSRNVVSSPALLGALVVFVARFEYDLQPSDTGAPGGHLLREYLVAVDPKAAAVVWQQELGHRAAATMNDIPELNLAPTPVSFAGDTSPFVAAASSIVPQVQVFDVSGNSVWTATLSAPTRSSPVFANGLLVVATDLGVVHAFSSDVNHAPLAPATGFSPADGEMIDGPTPTLSWAAAQDAENQTLSYEVRVMAAGGDLHESPLTQLESDAGKPSVTLARGLLTPGATYSFAVRSRDDHGAWSSWSPVHTFLLAVTASIDVAGQDFDSIDAAVASLPATGGQIDLGRGAVHLKAPLQVPAGVVLSGVSPQDTFIDGTGLKSAVQLTAAARTGTPSLKNLTVSGADVGVDVVDVQNAILRNIVVRDDKVAGLQVEAGAAAEAVNVTLVHDGTAATVAGKLNIHSSLVVQNATGLAQTGQGLVTSRYNDVFANQTADYTGVTVGTGDLSVAVTFKSVTDFHLAGLQPTTDRGDPGDAYGLEPLPNGARVNMGAFGNTTTAELSESVAGSTPVTTKVIAPEGPTPVSDAPPLSTAPGGGGSGCAVGGTPLGGSSPSSSSSSWMLLAIGGALCASRRRRDR